MTTETIDTPLMADYPPAPCSLSSKLPTNSATMNIEPLSDEHLASLNPGIRHTVKTLREWGFDTRDSGDGTTAQFECDLPHPYVHIVTPPATMASETDRLIGLLESHGINFADCPHPQEDPEGAAKHPCVEASYLPQQGGFAAIHVMNVILPENAEVSHGDRGSQPDTHSTHKQP